MPALREVIFDDPVYLESPIEWQQDFPQLQPNDSIVVEAEGDAPFYLEVLGPTQFAHRPKDSAGLTRFPLGSAKLRNRPRPKRVEEPGTYTLVVRRRTWEDTLDVDVRVELFRPEAAVAEGGDAIIPGYDRDCIPEARYLPTVSPYAFAIGQVLIFLGTLGAGLAVFFANFFALVFATPNPTAALPGLVAGDGTLALAFVTYRALSTQRRQRYLDYARLRRLNRDRGQKG
jgi:hypothetical protein